MMPPRKRVLPCSVTGGSHGSMVDAHQPDKPKSMNAAAALIEDSRESTMDHIMKRRDFMRGAAMGALAFTVGGAQVFLTAREARAQGVPFRLLKSDEAATIETLGETLLPGARAAGVAHFIDQQLSVPHEEALLEARILNVKPPYANFYRAAVGAIDKAGMARFGQRFADLHAPQQREFVDLMRQNKLEGWQGPPAPFVYLIARSDAVDVVFGTMEGYESLGIPYMAHIAPERRW
jgi:hypothetical protein